jgi:HEAT repeat protein
MIPSTHYGRAATLVIAVLLPLTAGAQSLERRILDRGAATRDGSVQFTFASRTGVCGDGETFLSDGLGGDNRLYENGNFSGWRSGEASARCTPGPVRVVVSTNGGEIIRLRTYVGLVRGDDSRSRDLGSVPVEDAVEFLTHLVERGSGRPAADAIVPIVLADRIDPWPILLRIARDERSSKAIRSTTDFWLARGAGFVLGVNGHDQDEDDDVRASAVFALSQQPKETAVPRLIEIVNGSTRPAVRAQALFWLGQSGDPRALDLFAEIFRRR